MKTPANIDVMIPTFNEEKNLPSALDSVCSWAKNVFVLDSGSNDDTRNIAEAGGARFVHQDWLGHARQKNWGLDNLPFESDWILILDADEAVQPELRDALLAIASHATNDVEQNGFYVNRYFIFLGKRIRHCGYYPSWNLRFFKRGKARYEEREVHEHMVVNGPIGYLAGHLEHYDRRGLEAYIAKHNRYSTLEAAEVFRQQQTAGRDQLEARFLGCPVERRRWIKQYLYPKLPAKWLFRFCFMYFARLGFLDGLAGLRFSLFLSTYELFISLKLVELKMDAREGKGIKQEEVE